ncbi:polysaccharide pyruvyl transferase family protein [bacterium]|nr:polysaccharide pyruvyl transferase family protein [bacterium]
MTNYLITGGGFNNKGAESMLYTLLTELRNNDANCKIYILLSNGVSSINNDLFENIDFINYTIKDVKKLISPFSFILKKNNKLLTAVKDADVIFDISGYILSSQWGKDAARILHIINLAKKYKKKIILLPQSFGPFDFPKKYKLGKNKLKKVLSYSSLIFAREHDGFNLLKDLGLNNIELSPDIVIQSSKPYSGFFTNKAINVDNNSASSIDIKSGSVLIFPNIRVIERSNKEKMLDLYQKAVNLLVENNYNVYISYYDLADEKICKEIFDLFENNNKVHFLDGKIDCIKFSKILPEFDFIISSRFHSIVHSYKNGIPVLAIGWAVKYEELLHSVGQDDFIFDGRNDIESDKFLEKIKYLIANFKIESEKIKFNVAKIQKNNCFDRVWECLSK